MIKKIPLIVIVGPTASGKSECAVRIAKKIKGEIISADSRQIYKDLTVGSAKVKGFWENKGFIYKDIPHFCIDMVSPKTIYTAAEFKLLAEQAIADIVSRNHMPILIGGTGLWIDALVYDLNFPHVVPDFVLRRNFEKKSVSELFSLLKKMDPRRAKTIEAKNPRRLIRAIEIAKKIGPVPRLVKKNPYHALWIGIAPDETILHRRIVLRSRDMIRKGLIQETKKLLLKGVTKKRIREFGFEYALALSTIEKKISVQDLEHALTKETISYTKRQMRWFIRNKEIQWFSTPQLAEVYTILHCFVPKNKRIVCQKF